MPYFFTFIYYFCIVELQQLKDRLWFIDIRQIWDTGGLIIQGYRITIIVVAFLFILTILLFFFYFYGDLRDLHSFPTRRSSDLAIHPRRSIGCRHSFDSFPAQNASSSSFWPLSSKAMTMRRSIAGPTRPTTVPRPSMLWTTRSRSEEHTSELQSLAYLVCRLLLE